MDISHISLIISAIAVASTICGWFVIHFMSLKRNFANKKKEIRISYLISAFRCIEDSVQRTSNDKLLQLESAIADIQLFGTKKQVELSRKFAMELAHNHKADAVFLLMDLRDDLRKELNLETVTNIQWHFLRIKSDSNKQL